MILARLIAIAAMGYVIGMKQVKPAQETADVEMEFAV